MPHTSTSRGLKTQPSAISHCTCERVEAVEQYRLLLQPLGSRKGKHRNTTEHSRKLPPYNRGQVMEEKYMRLALVCMSCCGMENGSLLFIKDALNNNKGNIKGQAARAYKLERWDKETKNPCYFNSCVTLFHHRSHPSSSEQLEHELRSSNL